jgi:formate dehydrogenase maturation protein FdhE
MIDEGRGVADEFEVVIPDVVQIDGGADQQRLARLEAQTQALAEAVIAMTAPSDTITAAIDAVRDEMATPSNTAPHDDGPGATRAPYRNVCPACGSLLTEPLHRSPDGHGLKYFRCTVCKQQWAPPAA